MAIFQNDPFPGTDYNSYQSWQQVKAPDGRIFYVVPGHPGYVYDPVSSNASGRRVFRANPQQAIADQQSERDAVEAQRRQQEQASSVAGQALPVALGTAGTVLSAAALNGSLFPSAAAAATGGGGSLATPAIIGLQRVGEGAVGLGSAGATGGAGVGGAGGGGAVAGGIGSTLLPLGVAAAGTYLGGRSAYDMINGREDDSIQGLIGRGTLGIATGGISEIARPFFMRRSTRQIARENTQDLQDVAPEDRTYQDYVAGMREQFNAAPPDPSKPFGGKYRTWQEAKEAGLDAADLTGVYGNIKAYGPAWASLTQEQRQAITQANIDSDLYYSKKGEVLLTDDKKAKENYDRVLAGFQAGIQTAAKPAPAATLAPAQPAPFLPVPISGPTNVASNPFAKPMTPAEAAARAVVDPARTTTRSPGIGLDGRRLVY